MAVPGRCASCDFPRSTRRFVAISEHLRIIPAVHTQFVPLNACTTPAGVAWPIVGPYSTMV